MARRTASDFGVRLRTVGTEQEVEGLVYEFGSLKNGCFVEIDVRVPVAGDRTPRVEEIERETPFFGEFIPGKVRTTLRLLPPLKVLFVERSIRPIDINKPLTSGNTAVFFEIEGVFTGRDSTFEATIPADGSSLRLDLAT